MLENIAPALDGLHFCGIKSKLDYLKFLTIHWDPHNIGTVFAMWITIFGVVTHPIAPSNYWCFCSAWPRLKLNTKIGLHTHHQPTTHHPPTIQTLRQQYLSCYWPDWDQTLNKGSWELIQQITTVTTTFVQATFVLGTFVHISNISAVTGPIWIKL